MRPWAIQLGPRGVAWLLATVALAAGCGPRAREMRQAGQNEPPARSVPARTDERPAETAFPIRLEDVTGETGISFVHTDGGCGRRYIVETVTAGLALFDYDGDEDVDIYFLNGSRLRGSDMDGPPPRNSLYRNEGNWRFTDVTEEAGVGDTGFGLGVAVGDYDNDGAPDIYLNNYGPNVLYRNNGDGTFTDVTTASGVDNGHKVGAGACFLDMDADGDLDLYVANYLKFSYEMHVPRTTRGFPAYPQPSSYIAEPDTVYRNNSDGTFSDVSSESGVNGHAGTGMGMVCADFDDDGDTDVFVLNDVSSNFLFQNDGTGRFQEVALEAGVAYDADGKDLGSMGVDCGDYDNDGRLDFFMTSYQEEFPVLYRNVGDGCFEDVTVRSRTGAGALPHVTWGTGFVDFDNDGDRDLFIACGHLQDNVEEYDDTTSYRVRNILLLNTGKGEFVDVSDKCGQGMSAKLSSRGAGFDDLDNDGDVDAVILNSREPPTILRNETDNSNHWIQIRLRGVDGNRDGVGARVAVVAGDLTQVAEVHGGRGYQSHWGSRLHFGLGRRDRVDRVEVRWIGGGADSLANVEVDRVLTVIEGMARSTE